MHPIFQYLDYSYQDYGGFAKVTDDRNIGGYRNVFVAGVNVINGRIDNNQYVNVAGPEGRAGVVVDRPLEEHVGLCRELALCCCRPSR